MEVPLSNKSQSSVGWVDKSITVSASWQKVCDEDKGGARGVLELMNVGTHNMGVCFPPLGNNGATPTFTATIGSAGVYTIVPTGSYEPTGGQIPSNEVWVFGTASDVLVASVTQ